MKNQFKSYGNPNYLLRLIMIVLLFLSCKNEEGNPYIRGAGRLRLILTDDPFVLQDISKVNITFDQIKLRKTEGRPDEKDSLDMEEGCDKDSSMNDSTSLAILLDEPLQLNLLDLRNGITLELATVDILPGVYDMIRVYISHAEIEFNNGLRVNLKIPSGSTSGLKIFFNHGLVVNEGETLELLLDFDLNRSIHVMGPEINPTGFHFNPVIRAVNNNFCGKIEGFVRDSSEAVIANADVWIEGDSMIGSTWAEKTGYYRMIGIPEGNYTLQATAEGYDTARLENIMISSRGKYKVDIQLYSISH